MGNYLVTGALGFIGTELCKRLLKRGNKVFGIDNLSTGSIKNLPSSNRFEFHHEDLCEINLIKSLADKNIEAIFHLAATVGVKSVIDSPTNTILNNVMGTRNVVSFARTMRIPLVFTSTSEVYGNSTKIPFSENDQRVLGAAHIPRWVYAESKALDEVMVLDLWRTDQVFSTVLRLFNTVGPNQQSEYGMVLPKFFHAATSGENITVYGNGLQTRTFCDVRDVVEAIILSLDFQKTTGEVFNVGTRTQISILELASRIKLLTESNSKVVHINPQEIYGKDFEESLHRLPNTSKIERVLGWTPRIELDRTLRDIAETYK